MALLNNTDGNPLQTDQAVRLNPAVNTGGTLTLPAVASKFHYITAILIRRVNGATAPAAGTALAITTTNLPGSLGWLVGNVVAAGSQSTDVAIVFDDFPLRSVVANTATTIVLPTTPGATVQWDVLVTYYLAS